MHKQRLGIMVLAGIGIAGTFMPWAKLSLFGLNQTINGTEGDGWITLGLFVIPLLFSLLGNRKNALKIGLLIGAIIASLLAGLVAANDLIGMMSAKYKADTLGASSIGIGLYVIASVSVSLPISALVLKGKAVKVVQLTEEQNKP